MESFKNSKCLNDHGLPLLTYNFDKSNNSINDELNLMHTNP